MAARRAGEPRQFKLVLIGESSVGKTCLLKRFVKNEFKKEAPTIAGHFLRKAVTTGSGVDVALNVWDTAGQERYFSVTRQFFRGADAAVVCYDITSQRSFDGVAKWISKLKEECDNPNIAIVICGNKSDLVGQREVSEGDARRYADSIGAFFAEVSAATDAGVTPMFVAVAETLSKLDAPAAPREESPVIRLNPAIAPKKESGCPC
eukprot:c53364_g1_i1.p1 GENE.c53364_g1_i1~~c53364_g1_i1.p1  ORF type:complete len:206 (-),score=32.97 c53364_g1_i1:151-768(-)